MKAPALLMVTALTALISKCIGADPYCSNGIKHPDPSNPACCAKSCGGQCGASYCANNGQSSNCCGGTINNSGRSCNSNDAPCTRSSTPTSGGGGTTSGSSLLTCSQVGGILSSNGACCAASCGSCGGTGCDKRAGGASSCCTGSISTANKACSTSQKAPCMQKTTTGSGGTAVAPAPAPIAAATGGSGAQRYVRVGLYTEGRSVQDRENDYGVKFDDVLIYRPVTNLNFQYSVKPILDSGRRAILNIEFNTGGWGGICARVANGEWDGQLRNFANQAAADGRQFYIRTFHEYNGDWYPWGLWAGNSVGDLQRGFVRVMNIFKDAGANVKWNLNINVSNPRDDPKPFSSMMPSNMWEFDSIAISCYDRAYTDQWHQFSKSFKDLFSNAYNQVQGMGKPIWVAETSTTDMCPNKGDWYRNMFTSVARDFPRVTQLTAFLQNKGNRSWDLNTQSAEDGFTSGFNSLRALT